MELEREACDNFDFNFLNESEIFFGDKSLKKKMKKKIKIKMKIFFDFTIETFRLYKL
jgi:hypothetical protein